MDTLQLVYVPRYVTEYLRTLEYDEIEVCTVTRGYIILNYTWWKLEMPTQCRTYEKMVRGALGSLESGVYPDVIPEARFCGKGTLPLLLKGSW